MKLRLLKVSADSLYEFGVGRLDDVLSNVSGCVGGGAATGQPGINLQNMSSMELAGLLVLTNYGFSIYMDI